MAPDKPRPVVLCILDGWGARSDSANNAIALAETPTWDRLVRDCPHTQLDASALEVGLPEGQMGNSEVGHMNLGAGRVVMQDLPRIDAAIADGSIVQNVALNSLIQKMQASGGKAHLMGLISPGGVHSHQNQMAAIARTVCQAGVPVVVHAFLDGRDTPPSSALGYMEKFLADCAGLDLRVGVVSGRYYAMDRDKRWERVGLAHKALVDAQGERAADAREAIQQSYDSGKVDEFVLPTVIGDYAGMQDGDGLIMGNFRADRAREILATLVDPAFDGFPRARQVQWAAKVGLVEYSKDLNAFLDTMFPPEELTHILGQVVSEAGRTQLRIAETEKYAHVTFFLNGGSELVFPGEQRILIPSPKVATYDLQPEMSAPEVTDRLVEAIDGGTFDLIVVNFANGDMVGHTGILEAAMAAARAVDASLARLEEAVIRAGGTLLITADHGNCEQMLDPVSGQPLTAHTLNPVPAILVNGPAWATGLHSGRLADVAPTLLRLLGLPQPAAMTGRSLIVGKDTQVAAAQ
ncbi:2,3-bisphosphoglycerate-independent phosphoglycerate mutase [Magnetospira thiophila]